MHLAVQIVRKLTPTSLQPQANLLEDLVMNGRVARVDACRGRCELSLERLGIFEQAAESRCHIEIGQVLTPSGLDHPVDCAPVGQAQR
jgi:hypothetical protein